MGVCTCYHRRVCYALSIADANAFDLENVPENVPENDYVCVSRCVVGEKSRIDLTLLYLVTVAMTQKNSRASAVSSGALHAWKKWRVSDIACTCMCKTT